MNKETVVYTMEIIFSHKKEGCLSSATTNGSKRHIVSEISQIENDKYHVCDLSSTLKPKNISKTQAHRYIKQTGVSKRLEE